MSHSDISCRCDAHSCLTPRLSSTFVGALAQALTSDRFGRRGSILIWSAIFTVGTAIQTGTVHSIVQITIGRFIAGLGVGALSGMRDCLHDMTFLGSLLDSHCSSVQWGDSAESYAWDASRIVPATNHHRVSRTFRDLCEAKI